MRKILIAAVLTLVLSVGALKIDAQEIVSRKALLDSLTTIDPEIRKFFPRWKICESDMQVQIYRAFKLLGYPEDELDMTDIEVLAIPREYPDEPFDLLVITCGKAAMNPSEIEKNLGALADYISGEISYAYGDDAYGRRDYCYIDIPPEVPVTENQAAAIISYLEPTNVTHAFTLSLFEQSVKIGESGFWLRSELGADEIGYPFWTSGEAKVKLKRPLYINKNSSTNKLFPTLLNVYLGAGYRITSGIKGSEGIFDFLPSRKLNGSPEGKLIAGFDFNAPFHPYLGLHFNIETPINTLSEYAIEKKSFGKLPVPTDENGTPLTEFDRAGKHATDNLKSIVPILQSTGQITLFYNWWLDESSPENYFRVDLGVSYNEVQEYAFYSISPDDALGRKKGDYLTVEDVDGLKLYKPGEFLDWLYFKAEYRNQAAYPFGFSVQYSNQIFLGRVYLPLISPWFYLEAKYSTPLRDARPYEIKNFFMISPVLRIAI